MRCWGREWGKNIIYNTWKMEWSHSLSKTGIGFEKNAPFKCYLCIKKNSAINAHSIYCSYTVATSSTCCLFQRWYKVWREDTLYYSNKSFLVVECILLTEVFGWRWTRGRRGGDNFIWWKLWLSNGTWGKISIISSFSNIQYLLAIITHKKCSF